MGMDSVFFSGSPAGIAVLSFGGSPALAGYEAAFVFHPLLPTFFLCSPVTTSDGAFRVRNSFASTVLDLARYLISCSVSSFCFYLAVSLYIRWIDARSLLKILTHLLPDCGARFLVRILPFRPFMPFFSHLGFSLPVQSGGVGADPLSDQDRFPSYTTCAVPEPHW